MAKLLEPKLLGDWGFGVVNSLEPDMIPENASPRGWNANLVSIGGEKAVVEKRRGFGTVNTTAISGATAILGQHQFDRRTPGAATYTRYHLIYSLNGRLDKLNSDDTTSQYDSTEATPFASGDTPPCFMVANNECFIANGERIRKATYDVAAAGERVYKAGIVRPSAPSVTTNAVGMTGTYDVRITYYNSDSGYESSASDTSTQVVVNQKVRVTIPAAVGSGEKGTHVRVGVRKQGLQTQFFQVAEVALGSGTYDINLTDDQLLALTRIMPDTAENDPPPVISVMAWRSSRAFMSGPADPSKVYHSQLGQPEQIDPENFDYVGKDDGEAVTAIIDAFEQTVCFKKTSIWSIRGDDPQSWVVDKIVPDSGTLSHRSVALIDGALHWWDPVQGPMRWTGPGSDPEPVGMLLISSSVDSDAVNYAKANRVVCSTAPHPDHNLVIWGTAEKNPEGEASFVNNGILFPWNYRLRRWASDKWNPMDCASLATIENANNEKLLYIGGYYGQIFRYTEIDSDGVDSGTKSGNVTSATSNTLTDSTAAFMTTGAGLKGRYAYVVAPGGFDVQRRRIGSNTGTQITLDAGLTWATTPVPGVHTYVIGGPDWQWDTANVVQQGPFFKKRFRFALHQMKTPADITTVSLDFLFDYSAAVGITGTFQVTPGGGIWDSAIWDVSIYGAQSAKTDRTRIGASGHAIRMRFRNREPDKRLVLLKAGVLSELKSEHLG